MTKKQKDMLKRILVTAVLYVALVAADHMKMISAVFTGWKMLFLYLIPYFVIGWDILYKAVRNIKNGQIFDENFLMAVATIGAFGVNEYSEAVAVMLFYQVGRAVPELCSKPFPPVYYRSDGYLSGICQY